MTTYFPPKKNTQYICYVSLVSQANTAVFQSNPTIAAGDFRVSIDGGALTNLATLPAVTPASSKMVKITLSTSEMNGDNITVIGSDASGAEWCDICLNLQTSVRQVDDLTFPNTSGRGMDVDASGGVEVGSVQAGAIASGSLASGELTNIADALLKRDFSSVTGEASRSMLNALRWLRNKWSISGTTMTVTKEDDATTAWTSTLTQSSSANPVTGSDPS